MKIVIVGGGTSGWLSAAALKHRCPFIDVTLIDKEVSTPVSVGEATLLKFEKFLSDHCGLDSNEFLKEIDATLKGGILFSDWAYENSKIWHPFYFLDFPSNDPQPSSMIDGWSHEQDYDFASLMALYQVSMGNKVDRDQLGGSYALHIDCIKLIEYLRKKLENKITIIESTVEYSIRDGDGNITELGLKDGTVQGDLFIDCTGHGSILKDKRDTVDLSDRLYVNAALAGHIPYTNREEQLKPYVSCPVVDSGWIWEIPLQSRIGSGIVFNMDITTPEEAKQEFYNHWGQEVDLKLIDWTPYYDKNQWDKNVISIGLSAGFIEPLESTGVALICEGIATACNLLESGYYTDHDIQYFNSWMIQGFEICTNFVNMHYSKSYRDTKFWRYVRGCYQMSDTQKFYLDNMKSKDRSMLGGKKGMFGGVNWIHWMIMMGFEFSPKDHMVRHDVKNILEQSNECLSQGENLMNHHEFVDTYLKKRPMAKLSHFRNAHLKHN